MNVPSWPAIFYTTYEHWRCLPPRIHTGTWYFREGVNKIDYLDGCCWLIPFRIVWQATYRSLSRSWPQCNILPISYRISYIFLFDGQLSVDKIFGSLWVLQLIKIWCLTYFYRGIKFWVNMSILSSRLMDILQVGGLDSSAKVVQSVRKSRINGEEQDSELSE